MNAIARLLRARRNVHLRPSSSFDTTVLGYGVPETRTWSAVWPEGKKHFEVFLLRQIETVVPDLISPRVELLQRKSGRFFVRISGLVANESRQKRRRIRFEVGF